MICKEATLCTLLEAKLSVELAVSVKSAWFKLLSDSLELSMSLSRKGLPSKLWFLAKLTLTWSVDE